MLEHSKVIRIENIHLCNSLSYFTFSVSTMCAIKNIQTFVPTFMTVVT